MTEGNGDVYSEKSLQVVFDCSILDETDFAKLQALSGDIEHSFVKHQRWRTWNEANNSVVTNLKFPTPDAKFWQAAREQEAHFSELVKLSFVYRQNHVKLRRLGHRREHLLKKQKEHVGQDRYKFDEIGFTIENIEIEMDRVAWDMKTQREDAKGRLREVMQWSAIKDRERPNLEFGEEDCNDHQHKSYLLRFENERRAVVAGRAALSGPEMINLISLYDAAMSDPKNTELAAQIRAREEEKRKLADKKSQRKKKKR